MAGRAGPHSQKHFLVLAPLGQIVLNSKEVL